MLLLKLLLLIELFFSICLSLPIKKMINGQDKICTNNYADGQISRRSLLRQIFGIKKHHAISKQINKFIVPSEYTGFKIIKQHNLKNGITEFSSDFTFNYCHEGELIFTKNLKQHNNTLKGGLDWEEPICILKNTDINKKTVILKEKHNSKIGNLKNWILTTAKIKQDTDDHKYNMKVLALNNIDNVSCFKVARRKRFANQEINIFLPNQFVGGIFKCDISDQEKKEIISTYMDDELNWLRNKTGFNNNINRICNEQNSHPLLPLVGDKIESYWTEYNGFKKKKMTCL